MVHNLRDERQCKIRTEALSCKKSSWIPWVQQLSSETFLAESKYCVYTAFMSVKLGLSGGLAGGIQFYWITKYYILFYIFFFSKILKFRNLLGLHKSFTCWSYEGRAHIGATPVDGFSKTVILSCPLATVCGKRTCFLLSSVPRARGYLNEKDWWGSSSTVFRCSISSLF